MAPTTVIADNNCNEESSNSFEMEIEAESAILEQIQNKMAKNLESAAYVPPTEEEQKAIDAKSVFIGNVDFNSTIEEVEEHFKGCGHIVRTTIPKDKFTKKQKNFAYIEFDDSSSIENALVMNGSLFRSRPIVVTAKRTNIPGMGHGVRGSSRGTFGRGRGAARGAPGRQQTVVVKYVYVNGPNRGGRGGRGRRFNPY
ncbi:Putative RNA-binding protein EEED8.12 [Caenorhabditis elegans]|uniref:Putative RNA-binding protein EEED8.12 n=1 Tax=Caenorhabditis elegans TaxID=6239 RepID=YQOC_CAEEL|nr:Putative RNA-binding protein EEED8.12 [Caenorhabditis elegans]Q09301.1 RecName: Full=Putative RNA-binding protein EEED8.12 [Caenorhabditis elegans]CCD68740.1 Putative RNA-binding protein EEED8.12 [Caenorhabditis elegans]|eukprot:NP_495021.1 Putative RNA-binding protein EEED8.12 [Caenorhabditis elegans]